MRHPTAQAETIRLGDADYPLDQLSDAGRQALDSYLQIDAHLHHLKNMQAVLNKARNAYISDLKHEVMQARTGLDLSDLLSDD